MTSSALAAALPHLTPRGWVALVLAALAWIVWYLLACAFYPFARCLVCKGTGRKYQSEKRKTWRDCRWCKGRGRRRRVGRAVWAYFKQTKDCAR